MTDEIEALARADEGCQRLIMVPGIGPIISVMVAAIGNGAAFAKGRDFAVWLGLVPKQMSTGIARPPVASRGVEIAYLRMLFSHTRRPRHSAPTGRLVEAQLRTVAHGCGATPTAIRELICVTRGELIYVKYRRLIARYQSPSNIVGPGPNANSEVLCFGPKHTTQLERTLTCVDNCCTPS